MDSPPPLHPVFLFPFLRLSILVTRILILVYRGSLSFLWEEFPRVGIYPKGGKKTVRKWLQASLDEAVKSRKSDGTVSPVRRLLQIPFTRVKSVSFFM
jgi:hypothetical protein